MKFQNCLGLSYILILQFSLVATYSSETYKGFPFAIKFNCFSFGGLYSFLNRFFIIHILTPSASPPPPNLPLIVTCMLHMLHGSLSLLSNDSSCSLVALIYFAWRFYLAYLFLQDRASFHFLKLYKYMFNLYSITASYLVSISCPSITSLAGRSP